MSARIIPTTLGKGWRLPGVGPPTAFWSFDGALERDLPCSSDSKDSARHAGDLGLIPESGIFPGEGNGYPLQCSCLENPMDRGAWWAAVRGVSEGHTRLTTEPEQQ